MTPLRRSIFFAKRSTLRKHFGKMVKPGKKEPVVDHLADALKKEIKNMK